METATALLVALAAPAARGAGLTDDSSHAPGAVTLPAAGGSFLDPVFGTRLIRVTDAADGTHCIHGYSYWPAFNADDTRLLLKCDDTIKLYRFDAATNGVQRDGTLTGSNGSPLQFEGATWSHDDPNVIYALDARGLRLWRVDVSRRGQRGYTLLRDFSDRFGSDVVLAQLSVSEDADVFTFSTRRRSSGAKLDAVVWERSSNRVQVFDRGSRALDETQTDKDGRIVMIRWDSGDDTVWDFRAGSSVLLRQGNATDKVSGHFDLGRDYIANSDGWLTGLVVRGYDALRDPENIVTYPRPGGGANWTIAEHTSLRSDAETFVVGSTYGGDGSWAPFEDEIYLAYTDGHGFVRLAHTRSYERNSDPGWRYYAQPRAVVDAHGRYVVFTSDLGSSERLDVMILKIPRSLQP